MNQAEKDLERIGELTEKALVHFRNGKEPELQAKLDQINEIANREH